LANPYVLAKGDKASLTSKKQCLGGSPKIAQPRIVGFCWNVILVSVGPRRQPITKSMVSGDDGWPPNFQSLYHYNTVRIVQFC